MGVFDDKKLEQLDWMTQITETIDSDLNGLLARLPDRLVLTQEYIVKTCSSSYNSSLSIGSVVRETLKDITSGFSGLSYDEEQVLAKCFKFQTEGEIEIDLEKGSMVGQITAVKTTQTLSDEELQVFMGSKGIEAIRHLKMSDDEVPLERLNEILDVLGGGEAHMKNRSTKKKIAAISTRLKAIFTSNEWRIRDMGLANKVGFWIKGYIQDGNLPCLINLCKVKAMTHNNMPIYSIVEEK